MTRGRVRIRVRYPEVDGMGVVHHSHYPVWFEVGRTELMRELGEPYAALEAAGLFMPVVEMGARYRVPVLYDEEVDVETRIDSVGGATVRFSYRVSRADAGVLAAEGFTVHASVGRDGAPVRMPAPLREKLRAASRSEGSR